MNYIATVNEVFINIDLEMLIRLVITAILGLLMGLERELKRKSLGLKTILVISIVSCLLTIVSIQSSYVFPATTFAEIRMDPLRLAAQIVSGIGFLGAGVILRRDDDTVSGLTTAAVVWGAAGIGIGVGAGFYIEAITGVALLLISIELIPMIINKLNLKNLHVKELFLKITLLDREDLENVVKEIENRFIEVKNVQIRDLQEEKYLIALRLIVIDTEATTEIYNKIAGIEEINTIELHS